MRENNSLPNLRFPIFEGDWKQVRLENLFEEFRSGNGITSTHISEVGEFPVYGGNGLRGFTNNFTHSGEYLLVGRQGALCGNIKLVTGQIYISEHAIAGRANKNNSTLWLAYKLDYMKLNRLSESSAQPGLSVNKLLRLKLIVPSLPEQQKIASFLSSVDERIELLERKKEKLGAYKKGVMQQIFSQQIRFRQDDGAEFPDWEERKLGEVANIKRGASPRPISDPKWFSINSQIGWVRISDVTKSSKTLTQTDQYLSQAGVKKSRPVKQGSIIMSICATIGKPIFTGFDVCIHDGFVVFEAPEVSEEFLFYLLQQIEPGWKKYGQPGIQLNLNTDIVSNEVVEIPSAKEQVKICAFLKALDDKITQTDQTLEKTRLWKKGLLQQMFV